MYLLNATTTLKYYSWSKQSSFMTVNIWISLKQTNKQILKAMKTFLDVQTMAWLKSTLIMMYSCCVICDGWYFGRTHQAPGQTGWCWLELTGPWTRQLTVIKWRPHFERELFASCSVAAGPGRHQQSLSSSVLFTLLLSPSGNHQTLASTPRDACMLIAMT